MWKCPKCGRTFKRVNQDHYCGEAPKTIDEYINAQDEEFRSQLYAVREAFKKSLPDAAEKIAWSMPTYCVFCKYFLEKVASKNGES